MYRKYGLITAGPGETPEEILMKNGFRPYCGEINRDWPLAYEKDGVIARLDCGSWCASVIFESESLEKLESVLEKIIFK